MGHGSYRTALANRALARALLAYTCGSIAVGIGAVVVAVSLFERTGSSTWATVGATTRVLPFVALSSVGGLIADRTAYTRLLRLALAAQFGAALVIAVVATSAPLALVAAAGLLANVLWTVVYPTMAAFVPTLVDERDLAAATALLSTLESAAWIVGPGLGGLLINVSDVRAAALVGALVALGAALLAASVGRGRELRASASHGESMRAAFAAGFRTIAESATVRLSVAILLVSNLVFGAVQVLLLVGATELLGMGDGGYGALTAAVAVGAFGALFVVPRAARSRRSRSVLAGAVVLSGAPLAVIAAVPAVPLAIVLLAVAGLATVLTEVLVVTSLQRNIPGDKLARVFGILDSLIVGAILVGTVMAAPLIRVTSEAWALAAVGAVLASAAAVVVPRLPAQREVGAADLEALAPVIALLRGLPMLRLASPTSVEAMAAAARIEELPANTVVVQQGGPTDDFYAILDGRVAVDVTHVLGGVERVRFLGPGSGFGELGLLQGSPRTATVTTVADSRLVRVPGEVFLRSVGPGVAYGGFGPGAAILDYVMAR